MKIIRQSATEVTYTVTLEFAPIFEPSGYGNWNRKPMRPTSVKVTFRDADRYDKGPVGWEAQVTGPQVKKDGSDSLVITTVDYQSWQTAIPAPQFVLDIVASLQADALRAIEVH